MSNLLTEPPRMAGRKKESFERGRVEFLADPAWIKRVNREAELLGLNISALARMVLTEWVEKREAERASHPKVHR